VYLYDAKREVFHFAASSGLPPEFQARARPVPRAVFDARIEAADALAVVRDVQTATDLPNAPLYAEINIRSAVSAGMQRDEQLIGVLSVFSVDDIRHFTEDELALLRGLADQATQAIANARLFDETQRRLRHMQALHAIDLAITSSLDLRLTLNILLGQAAQRLSVDAADVLLLSPRLQTLGYAAGHGFRTRAIERTSLHLGEGLAGHAALGRERVHVSNLAEAPSTFTRTPLLEGEGFVAYYGVPLIAKGRVTGVLEIFHRAPLDAEQEWLDFLEALADQAAIAIDNAALFDGLQRSNLELIRAYDATIEGWSHALDLRDEETEGHSERVMEMTIRLAQSREMSAADLVHVRRGALLHDIGKMGIPDDILLKPGPLTNEEWTIMRKHPQYAYEMLSPIAFLRPALDIPYCHHEKWDGTGYPRGLMGDRIPLAARLFAVVDVWDALRSDRPYRQGWPEAEVMEHIHTQAGRHFDPEVVDAFLRMIQ
jgi:putative nucleotidyltransferase with HDIG domain